MRTAGHTTDADDVIEQHRAMGYSREDTARRTGFPLDIEMQSVPVRIAGDASADWLVA